jgi:hypothetical protein
MVSYMVHTSSSTNIHVLTSPYSLYTQSYISAYQRAPSIEYGLTNTTNIIGAL